MLVGRNESGSESIFVHNTYQLFITFSSLSTNKCRTKVERAPVCSNTKSRPVWGTLCLVLAPSIRMKIKTSYSLTVQSQFLWKIWGTFHFFFMHIKYVYFFCNIGITYMQYWYHIDHIHTLLYPAFFPWTLCLSNHPLFAKNPHILSATFQKWSFEITLLVRTQINYNRYHISSFKW